MQAVWYDRQGPAAEVLQVGELPDPQPGPGELRVRLTLSDVNPGDTKKRRGWLGSAMPFPRVIPHSDRAGVIESVGAGVDPRRVGARVWGCSARSLTGPSVRPRSWRSSRPGRPSTFPMASATRSVPVWGSRGSPRTARCSPTAR